MWFRLDNDSWELCRAFIFEEQVDAQKLNIPDYHDIVKEPMCLLAIKEKIESNAYNKPEEFYYDMQLTWDNAILYNPSENDVHKAAIEIKEYFTQKWDNVKESIATKFAEEELAERLAAKGLDPAAKAMKRDRTSMSVKKLVENGDFANEAVLSYDAKVGGCWQLVVQTDNRLSQVSVANFLICSSR